MITRAAIVVSRRPLVALLVAEVVSTTGTLMTSIALPWFVLATTHSPARSAFVLTAQACAVAASGVVGGRWVAGLGTRRTMLACDLVAGVVIGLVPTLHRLGVLTSPVLLVIAFASGLSVIPFATAQEVIVPELVGTDEASVARVSAFLQSATRLTYLLGPALGGVLVDAFGAASVLWIDAVTYFASLIILGLFLPKAQARPATRHRPRLAAGAVFLWHDRLLRPLTLGQAGSQMAFQGLMLALPILAFTRYHHNAHLAGLFAAMWGAGALAGTLTASRLVNQFNPLAMGAAAWVCYGLSLWLLAPAQPAALLFVPLTISGMCNGLRNPPLAAIRILSVPPAVRPHALAAASTSATLGGTLALAVIGSMIDQIGLTAVFGLIAAISTLAAVSFTRAAFQVRTSIPLAEKE